MTYRQTLTDASGTVADWASRTTYGGAGAAFLGTLAQIDWVSAIACAVAILGFIVNFYYRRLENKRQEEQHELEKMQDALRVEKLKLELQREACKHEHKN